MGLFSLTDISFGQSPLKRGPLNSLLESKYSYNNLRYPLDIGNFDKGHYMVIHINEQRKTQFPSNSSGLAQGDLPAIVSSRMASGTTPTIASGVKTVGEATTKLFNQYGSETANKITNSINSVLGGGVGSFIKGAATGTKEELISYYQGISDVSFARTIKRTADTIALYMPDTLNFTYNQTYSDLAIGGTVAAGALAAGVSTADAIKANSGNLEELGQKLGKNLAPFAAAALANSTDIGRVIFAAGTGTVVNPMLEILYTSPAFRTFRFDFLFYPREEREAKEVQDILDRLRFHQAPEIVTESGGFFMVPPSEFDIKFFYNGKENPNIPSISTCVLETIDVDYAPNGFSAYEVPGEMNPNKGRTGMPVAIRLSLQFKETEIITKQTLAGSGYTQHQQPVDYT
jgi:hypothetical protein